MAKRGRQCPLVLAAHLYRHSRGGRVAGRRSLGSETLAGPRPSYLSHGILQRWAGLLPGARRGEVMGRVLQGPAPPWGRAAELLFLETQVGGSLLVLHLLGFKPPSPLQTFPPDRETRGLGTPMRGWERTVRVLQARGTACTKTGGGERLRLYPWGSGML